MDTIIDVKPYPEKIEVKEWNHQIEEKPGDVVQQIDLMLEIVLGLQEKVMKLRKALTKESVNRFLGGTGE